MGFVTQEVVLFNDTVRNNIAYGRGDVDEALVIAAAKAANAHDFISALPQGYDTEIGESGVLLSRRTAPAPRHRPRALQGSADPRPRRSDVGARHRVGAARAAGARASDEGTDDARHRAPALDHPQRRQDRRARRRARSPKSGTHEELLARRGVYRKLYDLQFLEEERPVTVAIDEVDRVPRVRFHPRAARDAARPRTSTRRTSTTRRSTSSRSGTAHLLLMLHSRCRRPIAVDHLADRRTASTSPRVFDWYGVESARGSSTRGGSVALREMIRDARDGKEHRLHARRTERTGAGCEGRRGLRGESDRASDRADRLRREKKSLLRSWDRMVVPLPFTRAIFLYGEPIVVPRDGDVEEWRRVEIEERMNALADEARARFRHTLDRNE